MCNDIHVHAHAVYDSAKKYNQYTTIIKSLEWVIKESDIMVSADLN